MNKNTWILLFFAALAGDITGILLHHQAFEYICKPLLMPLLIIWFFRSTPKGNRRFDSLITTALLFSWVGDMLLMGDDKDFSFFLFGLGSFLAAHILYIVFFRRVWIRENIKVNPWLVAIVVVYYMGLIALLSPYLGVLTWPVRAYGIAISGMFLLAMHMLFIKNKQAGKWMMVGALLFVVSDSVLAVNMFYQEFEGAGVIVMVTYGLAQLFIVKGAIRYINEWDKG